MFLCTLHFTTTAQVERAFGVMKKRFAVLRNPLEMGSFKDMWLMYYTCVALHNFIREEKGESMVDREFEAEVDREILTQPIRQALYCNGVMHLQKVCGQRTLTTCVMLSSHDAYMYVCIYVYVCEA